MMLCPPVGTPGYPRVLTRGIAHTSQDSVLHLPLPLIGLSRLLLFCLILPLQVQGAGEVVVERLRRALNQLAADYMVGEFADEINAFSDGDDDDSDADGPPDPADYPGLFSDDVSRELPDVTLTLDHS